MNSPEWVNRDGQPCGVSSAYPPDNGVMADIAAPTLRAITSSTSNCSVLGMSGIAVVAALAANAGVAVPFGPGHSTAVFKFIKICA
jgi:hypothetical protein